MNNVVIKAGLAYTVGNILIKGIGFISIPLFTRLMSTLDYGIFNIYIAYESIIYILIGLALNASLKSAKLEFNNEFNKYISTICCIIIINTLTILVICNCIYSFVDTSIIEYSRMLINILIIHSAANSFLVIYNAVVSIDFDYKNYLKIAFLNSFGGVLLSIFFIKYIFIQETYLGRIIGVFTTLLITAIYINIYFLKKSAPEISKKYIFFAFKYSLPIIPHGISQILLAQFDRIMIKRIIGFSEAGIYSFVGNISSIMKVVTSSIESAWGPWFFREHNKGNAKKIKFVAHCLIRGFSFFTILIMLCMPEILKLISPSSYWDGIRLVVPMALDVFCTFLYTLYVQIEYYYKKTNYIMIATVMAVIMNIILNLLFIPKYGYIIAAYTTLISYIIYFIFHFCICFKIMGEDIIGLKENINEITTCIIVAYYASKFYNDLLLRWGLAIVISLAIICISIKEVKKAREMISEKN